MIIKSNFTMWKSYKTLFADLVKYIELLLILKAIPVI